MTDDSHSGVPVEGLTRKERRNVETLTRRADFLDERIGGVVGEHTDRDRQELRALRWALDRLAAAPREASEPLIALAQSWETAAQRMGERALVGDPSAVIASVRALEGCAAQLRAALAPREAKTPGEREVR